MRLAAPEDTDDATLHALRGEARRTVERACAYGAASSRLGDYRLDACSSEMGGLRLFELRVHWRSRLLEIDRARRLSI